MLRAGLVALSILNACSGDESVSGYTPEGAVYSLSLLDGQPVDAPLQISFPEEGAVAGKGPCNDFTASQPVPYPWISIEDIAITKRACPELAAEAALMTALAAMTLVEAAGDVLILSNDDGREMVFRAAPASP